MSPTADATPTPTLLTHHLGPGARAFTTTRHGGWSKGQYAEFNINPHCGDDATATEANRRLLAAQLGIDSSHIIVPHQVHGTELRIIAAEYFALSAATQSMLTEGVDGLLTAERGVCIGVSTADCFPILLHDPRRHAIAAIHAGWRGTQQRIARRAVEAMARLGCRPDDLRASIGPGISLDAFEVGDEVYEAFAQAQLPMESISRRYPSTGDAPLKWHIDLAQCNILTLMEAGVKAENIGTCDLCTYSHSDQLFSARRLGTASGRLYTGIMLD